MHIYHLLICGDNMYRQNINRRVRFKMEEDNQKTVKKSYSRVPPLTTAGAHSCSWVSQEADMWAL